MTNGRNALVYDQEIRTDPTPQKLAKIRKKEALKASSILGVKEKNIHFLDYEDGKLKHFREAALKNVEEIIYKWDPTEIFYPYIKPREKFLMTKENS